MPLAVISAPAGFFQIAQVNNATILDLTSEINDALSTISNVGTGVAQAASYASAANDAANLASSWAATAAAFAAASTGINFATLPTSNSGLAAGTPWNNGGALCIA